MTGRLNAGRIPSLDGLRAVSIMMVLVGHLRGTRGLGTFELAIGDYAHLGVLAFFVISGFLITSLLLSEQAKTGTVSLRRFYARRALRIFPVSYGYIAVIGILTLAGVIHVAAKEFWYAVTYTMNCVSGAPWVLSHLWSLSVEEQFYLLWPAVFVATGSRRVKWLLGTMLFAFAARVAAQLFLLPWNPYVFPLVADSLAAGCLLAILKGSLERSDWYLKLFRPLPSLGLAGLVLFCNRYIVGGAVSTVFVTSLINILLAILIHRCVYCYADWAGKLLNSKPFVVIGTLSYSLYIWQEAFLDRTSGAWIAAFPQNILLAFAAASASYALLERPLLRIRGHMRPQ